MTRLFPYSTIRPIQEEFIETVEEALAEGRHLLAHAPTGLGKTVASLAPALEYALENEKVIFFLTSRHTQHKIAIETLQKIKETKDIEFNVVDFIGKKNMCLVSGAQALSSGEFFEYCRTVSKKDYTCPFYVNTRKTDGKPTLRAEAALETVKNMDLDSIMEFSNEKKFCPYELSLLLSQKATVIVCDYYYIFNDSIRNMLLNKMEKDISEAIIIVDEAHNLPFRIRDLMTEKTTSNLMKRAAKEAEKYQFGDIAAKMADIAEKVEELGASMAIDDEARITKQQLSRIVERTVNGTDVFLEELEDAADTVRENQKMSFMGSFAVFMRSWQGDDDGYARIIAKKEGLTEPNTIISYRCLDPSVVSRNIITSSYSTILMSAISSRSMIPSSRRLTARSQKRTGSTSSSLASLPSSPSGPTDNSRR
ncbi:MAG: DEAD/DEAH box helicase family protein [Nanoarchaeota archaeon]